MREEEKQGMEEKLKESHSFGPEFPPPARAERKTQAGIERERERRRSRFFSSSVERCRTDGNLFALGSVSGRRSDTWQQADGDRNWAGWGLSPDIIR